MSVYCKLYSRVCHILGQIKFEALAFAIGFPKRSIWRVERVVCSLVYGGLQAVGIAAMERGVRFGAKPKLTENQIAEMKQKRSQGVLIKDLMTQYKLSKASVYRLMSEAS